MQANIHQIVPLLKKISLIYCWKNRFFMHILWLRIKVTNSIKWKPMNTGGSFHYYITSIIPLLIEFYLLELVRYFSYKIKVRSLFMMKQILKKFYLADLPCFTVHLLLFFFLMHSVFLDAHFRQLLSVVHALLCLIFTIFQQLI